MCDAPEQVTCPRDVTHALVQVGKDVPLPEVAIGGVPTRPRRTGSSEHLDRPVQVAAIGKALRRDDPPFRQHLGLRRAAPQLAPHLGDACVTAERALGVHESGEHIGIFGEVAIRVEVPDGVAPPADPVRGKPAEAAHGRDLRSLAHHLCTEPERIVEAGLLERPDGALHASDQQLSLLRRRARHGTPYLGGDVGREHRGGNVGGRRRACTRST